jgi:hypothetical protein
VTLFNESRADRAARMLGGLLLLFAGWTLSFNILFIVLFVLGGMALTTGLVGWCPAYTLFGISTVQEPAGDCPDCDREHRLV